MKNNKEEKITIPIMIYEDLILTRQNYFKIVDYLLDFMKYFCPMQFNVKLEELKQEEEKNV